MKKKIAFSVNPYRILLCGIVVALGIVLDQVTKYLAVLYLKGVDTVPIWKDVFHLTYVENRGAAFGMLSEHRWVFLTLTTVAVLCMIGYSIAFGGRDRRLTILALSLIISGGIGNMIDRVALGYVVDFFDFVLIDFAVFNVADSLICIGAGLLLLSLILAARQEERQKKSGVSPCEKP